MSACNLRGFQMLSGNDLVNCIELKSTFSRNSGNDILFNIESKFHTIQNIKIFSHLNKEYKVFLTDKDKNVLYDLGSTSFKIFPNTSMPYSEPFYNFLKPDCALLIKNVDCNDKLNLVYERSLLSQNLREYIGQSRTKDYKSLIEFNLFDLDFQMCPRVDLKIFY